MLTVGDKAPNFTLLNQDREEIKLSDYEGSWLILFFYPRNNGTSCTQEAKDFHAALNDFEELGAEVLGISPDSYQSHKSFLEEHELDLELLSDEAKAAIGKYRVWGKVTLGAKETEGLIRSTFLISPDQQIAASWTAVKVPGHVESVLSTLKALDKQNGKKLRQ